MQRIAISREELVKNLADTIFSEAISEIPVDKLTMDWVRNMLSNKYLNRLEEDVITELRNRLKEKGVELKGSKSDWIV